MQHFVNPQKAGVFHVIGIGGIGMSGIADILHSWGYTVQGSDTQGNYNTERLQKLGIKVFVGHHGANIKNANYVLVSTAISSDNVEYKAAQEAGIPIVHRTKILAEIMRMKTCICVSGSHGKTSTTSIIAKLFEAADFDPTVITGGIIREKMTNAYVGNGKYMIVEADESDATFVKVPATVAVITNIDPEHLDFYGTYENLKNYFKAFLTNLPFYGLGVCCIDHPAVREIIKDTINCKIVTYGISSEDANVRAFNIRHTVAGSFFDVNICMPKTNIKVTLQNLYLSIPGVHNILNCLAAIAVAIELDININAIVVGLANFHGVKRRFSKAGEYRGISFIDDYAHHPAEIRATLATAKQVINPENKIISIFQPHRYSRLVSLFDDFVRAFGDSQVIYVMPVYSAGENKIEGYDQFYVAESIAKAYSNKKVIAVSSFKEVEESVLEHAQEGDIILCMGAGNITELAYSMPQKFNSK